jgi:para-nitrobenzyl esterase
MKIKALTGLAIFILLISFACTKEKKVNPLVVNTKEGIVKGIKNSGGDVIIFKGVPYAAPPVGENRWREPQPHKSWTDTLVCDTWPASAMQGKPVPFNMWTEEFIAPPEPLSEDCLYLNIWKPSNAGSEKLPVLVWIHGGGFVSGAGSCAVYDGEDLAKQGIIYISINYRLGIFGFFSHPSLSAESPNHTSGNYAFLDQLASLKWVKDNIAAFGGDPTKVTIAGQSAGSIAVNALVASPLGKDLFVGAIAHSGGMFNNRFSKSLVDAEKIGEEVVTKLNLENIEQLRQAPADSLLKIVGKFPYGSFGPTIDGYVLPDQVKNIVHAKKQNQVPMISGWVTGDGGLLAGASPTAESFKASLQQQFGDKSTELLTLFPANNDEEAKASQMKLGLMNFAAYPSYAWAMNNDKPTWVYEFSHVPTDKPDFPNYGAFHTSDVPYALHTLKLWNRPWQERDYTMETVMSSYWLNFVKTGNPNGNGLPEWKNYSKEEGVVIELNEGATSKRGLFKSEFEVMDKLN